jgi:hypothetical protein
MLSRASLLYRGNREWPASRILLQLASETPDESLLGQAASRWRTGGWDMRPWLQSQHRQPVVLPSMVLEGHQGDFSSFIALELEGGMLLSRHVDYRLWNLETGECQATYPVTEAVLVISSRPGSQFAHPPQDPRGRVLFWSAEPATIRFRHCDAEGLSMCNAIELRDGRVVSRRDARTLQADSPTQPMPPCLLEGHDDDIAGFLELADGRVLSWGTDSTLRLWTLSPVDSEVRTVQALTVPIHSAPILGAIELPNGVIVSWDFAGRFAWTELQDPPVSRFLEGMSEETRREPRAVTSSTSVATTLRESYREAYDPEPMWQRGSLGSDHAAAGAQWVECDEGKRVLTWKEGVIHWYDANGFSVCRQEFPPGGSDELTGVIHLPGFGTARICEMDNLIVLQPYTGEKCTVVEEPEARSISGILLLAPDRFCTWSGRKRGDADVRIWSAIDGDWHQGVQLEERLEGHSRWIHTVSVLRGQRLASCGEDDAVRVWDLKARGPALARPLEANAPRYIGDGTWRLHLQGYANTDIRYPLILLDALRAGPRVFDDIRYVRIPPGVIADRGLAIVENELVIDAEGAICAFETQASDDVVNDVSRAHARIQAMGKQLLLSLRPLGADGENIKRSTAEPLLVGPRGAEITAWVRTFMDEHYWQAAWRDIHLPGMRPLVRLGDETFAAWGDADHVEVWRITLEDFGEQDVHAYRGPASPARGRAGLGRRPVPDLVDRGWPAACRRADGPHPAPLRHSGAGGRTHCAGPGPSGLG